MTFQPAIRVGIVGLSTKGWASKLLAPSLLHPSLQGQISIVALSTRSESSAVTTAQKYSEETGYEFKAYHGDTSAIAADPDVDLIVVSVKAPDHLAALMPVIEAGKDFFVEWPAGAGLEQTIKIADAAKRKGIRTMVGLQARQSPVVRKVKEIIDSGRIGPVISSTIYGLSPRAFNFYPPTLSEEALYANDPKNGATVLHIAIGHFLDVFTHVLGDFKSISATATTAYPTGTVISAVENQEPRTIQASTPDHYSISGVLKSGALVTITWRSGLEVAPGRRVLSWEIEGECGTIRLENNQLSGGFLGIADPELYLDGEKLDVPKPQDVSSVPASLANLVSAWMEFLKGDGVGHYATMDDAVKNHTLLDAIQRSVENGARYNL